MPLARAMALANAHYYATREPFGATGDFVTAPEVSQMFGELLGAWAADLWLRAARPQAAFVELGPGRGTLAADLLRVAARAGWEPQVHFVERSPRLRLQQKAAVPQAVFHDAPDTLPQDRPLLLVANEFLDALPLTQFVRTGIGWALRTLAAPGGRLAFEAVEPVRLALIPDSLRHAPEGAILERGFAAGALVAAIGRRIARQGGAALFIDYGYEGPALGETLQALKGGEPAPVLEALGEGDLSAHVDFAAMREAAVRAGVRVFGPVPQGAFLVALGLAHRSARLKAGKPGEVRARIAAEAARLAGAGAMGGLFRVLALTAPGWPEPAGFSRIGG